jgi:diguanylate cyclase (GGDEF)-like protein
VPLVRRRRPGRGLRNRRLAISARFFIVLVVFVPALGAVALVGWQGLRAGQRTADSLYLDHLVTAQATTDLRAHLADAHERALEILVAAPADRASLMEALVTQTVPEVDVEVAALRISDLNKAAVDAIVADWQRFHVLLAQGTLAVSNAAQASAAASQVTAIFEQSTANAQGLTQVEQTQAAQADRVGQSTYHHHVQQMLIILAIALLAGVGMVLGLIRSVLPRTLAYAHFADLIANGDDSAILDARGNDELGDLGRTLEHLAITRRTQRSYEQTQLEFTDTLQVTADEHEAHELIKRHLERTLPGVTVSVLNRNNSADRLEAVTAVPATSPLIVGLDGAEPRSCLAVRFARPYLRSHHTVPLLACRVCAACPSATTCTPLLVSGEVIGSVLTEHSPDDAQLDERRIRESVSQAAPVLANLRNLAIAEMRASTDTLTGLPNRRAIQATLKRMVAQASRTVSPLSALMIDLDHFKHINDQHGHDRGDEVLAGVGAALDGVLRASDFAGRWGGEEFMVLLPDTNTDGATHFAERVRSALGEIYVDSVDAHITASIGVATIPDHATDAEHLERSADRALYTAKRNGRDRVEIAHDPTGAQTDTIQSAVNPRRARDTVG